MKQKQRIIFLDAMRGFAVIVMVMGHSIDSVLSVEARSTDLFRLYDALRGFTAPMFLFVSGLVFTVGTEKRWLEYVSTRKAVARRFLKFLALLAIGYALHFPFFSLTKIVQSASPDEYAQFFQVDILHCVAVSLMILQATVILSRTPQRFAVAIAALAAGIVLATPYVWQVDFGRLLAPAVSAYFNQQHVSIFPMFPYSAFVFLGAAIGHLYLEAKRREDEHRFFAGLLIGALGLGAAGIVFDILPVSLYPPQDYWKTSPNFFLIRIAVVLLVTVGFFYVRKIPDIVMRQLIVLGQASLFVYVSHVVTVYGSAANEGLTHLVGRSLSYSQSLAVALAVLLSTLLFVHVWNHVRMRHFLPARFVQIGFVSTLLYLFFTKPY
jgi:uncharacterized membrane protein